MKRGFLFAPLVGTIVVMAVMLYITHIMSLERTGVALVTSDSYHNRLVTILETTRSDTASAFKIGVQKSIVEYTLSQGWLTTSTYSGGSKWALCEALKTQMHAGICSVTRLAGLPYWLNLLGEPIYFEGVIFKPCDAQIYETFTYNMMGYKDSLCSSVFDRDKLFNCSSLDKIPSCGDLPDCDDGTFWLRTAITKAYSVLPRLCAEDGSGNQIRSEAISGEDFAMHIRLRTFNYVNIAANMADIIAYGTGEGCSGVPGIDEGFCIGKGCDNLVATFTTGFKCTTNTVFTSEQLVIEKAKQQLDVLANKACENVKDIPQNKIYVPNCIENIKEEMYRSIVTKNCGGQGEFCAYVDSLRVALTMNDRDTTYEIATDTEVKYPFTLTAKYDG